MYECKQPRECIWTQINSVQNYNILNLTVSQRDACVCMDAFLHKKKYMYKVPYMMAVSPAVCFLINHPLPPSGILHLPPLQLLLRHVDP